MLENVRSVQLCCAYSCLHLVFRSFYLCVASKMENRKTIVSIPSSLWIHQEPKYLWMMRLELHTERTLRLRYIVFTCLYILGYVFRLNNPNVAGSGWVCWWTVRSWKTHGWDYLVLPLMIYLELPYNFFVEKELKYLKSAVTNPKRPFLAIIGGSKVCAVSASGGRAFVAEFWSATFCFRYRPRLGC